MRNALYTYVLIIANTVDGNGAAHVRNVRSSKQTAQFVDEDFADNISLSDLKISWQTVLETTQNKILLVTPG